MHRTTSLAGALLLASVIAADAQTWSELNPPARPSARAYAHMAFDVKNGRAVLFGGSVGSTITAATLSNETWLWDGTNWTKAAPPTSPTPRRWSAMVYDEERGEIVLFGGFDDTALSVGLADTWVWNGSTWTQKTPANSPPARYSHAMAYDPVRKVVVLFGGYGAAAGGDMGDTWTWNGTNWTRMTPPVSPPARSGHHMAWDGVRQAIVSYSGFSASHTWTWDGTTWTNRTGTTNPGTGSYEMVSHAGQVLLLDGGKNRVWTWDGSEWRDMVVAGEPPAAVAPAAAYDPVRGRTLRFGGWDGKSATLNSFWSFALGSACFFSDAQPANIDVAANGGTVEVPISVPAGCSWSAMTNSSRISILNGTGNGPGTLRFSIAANPGPFETSETVVVSGRPYVIRQARPACSVGGALPSSSFQLRNDCDTTYTFTANAGDQLALLGVGRGQTYGPRDGYSSSYVNFKITGPGSATTVIGSASHPDLIDPAAFLPGSGVITFPSAGTYNIEITLSGGEAGYATIYPLRGGGSCTPQLLEYSIYSPLKTTTALAALFAGIAAPSVLTTVYVVAVPPGCPGAGISSASPWIQPSPASAPPGFTKLNPGIPLNLGPARSGTLNIGALAVPVTQEAVACTYSLSSTAANAPAGRSSGTVQVNASGSVPCPWPVSSDAAWLQPYPLWGHNNAPVNYNVFPNFSTKSRTGTLTVADKTFTVTQAPDSGTALERYVRLLYFSFFGRMPAANEVAFQAGSGQSREQLALNFLNSGEFNQGGRFVAGLYVGLLDREAEYGGWLFQRDALASGYVNNLSIVANFLGSAEFVQKFGTLDNRAFVSLLYNKVLLRPPSPEEVDFQAGALAAGISRAQLARNFLDSTEFRIGTGPRLMGFLLFATLLQRQPTPAEFAGASAVASQAQAKSDLTERNAFIRDQLLAPVVNGSELAQMLQ